MGVYSDYLDRLQSTPNFDLDRERKLQLNRIATIRGRKVITYAADISKGAQQCSMDYSDLLPFTDLLSGVDGTAIDLILETPGGSGEVAEQIVEALRTRFTELGIIIPGWAKSAGTIVAMAGDEILMGKDSALGPIDAQITQLGKRFSAHALLSSLDRIKDEVTATGKLNPAYIPILQGISAGELESARNAQDFAVVLVTEWLKQFKFRTWTTHSSTNAPVTEEEKSRRAAEIAKKLGDHAHWKSHNRSIKIEDFAEMRLKITDYSSQPELADAIVRYFTILRMQFDGSGMYKIIETVDKQVMRHMILQQSGSSVPAPQFEKADLNFRCNKCQKAVLLQASFTPNTPLEPGRIAFPQDNIFLCSGCGAKHNLLQARQQIEAQFKRKVLHT